MPIFQQLLRCSVANWTPSGFRKLLRKRKVPAQLVIWLVIGMAMFRDRSISEVVSHLGLVLPS
ncbi:MAG: transposase domain-containing protein, partial [Deltaproteobacteria bacterium]|nr:transposase domain-containing protein [Deltaproteobacteria bacterium]